MIKKIAIEIIRLYQKYISPLLGQRCRFYPTCSEYMIQAIQLHGFFKGIFLGIKRILRCNPLFKGGIDNVPKPKEKTKNKARR